MGGSRLGARSGISCQSAFAPAKINLTLDVVGLRGDGFHELRSLAVGVGLCDRIDCRLGAVGDDGIRLDCADASLATNENLAWRAARRLAQHVGIEPSVTIDLEKRIPIGAGLGGGSSDAATTLLLCNALWRTGLERHELAALAADIGSDVPMFFLLPSALMTGRGERVQRVQLAWSGFAVLVFCGAHVSTAAVYRAWRPSDAEGMGAGLDAAALAAVGADELASVLSNHLEPAVFRVCPEVARVFGAVERLEVGQVRVSGAGSAMYLLFDKEEAARSAAHRVEQEGLSIKTVVVRVPFSAQLVVNSGGQLRSGCV